MMKDMFINPPNKKKLIYRRNEEQIAKQSGLTNLKANLKQVRNIKEKAFSLKTSRNERLFINSVDQ